MYRSKAPVTVERATIKVEELCAKAERCSDEIRQKLRRMGLQSADIDAIIEHLTSRRFIDDSRFARAFVRDKVMFARWGKRKIRQALLMKRIPGDIISAAIDEINDDQYEEVLRHILNVKRQSIAEPDTYEGKTKLFRFGISRGFEPDLVATLIRQQ
jgi:regulatory protein